MGYELKQCISGDDVAMLDLFFSSFGYLLNGQNVKLYFPEPAANANGRGV